MTLYIKTGCQFCARARTALDAYALSYTIKNVADPQVREELIALGGKKQEPFLVDGDHMMYESQTIVKYIEDTYGAQEARAIKPLVHFVQGGEVCNVQYMYVHVHVVPGARKERVTKKDDARLYIEVKEPAELNMANKRIREILAHEFEVPEAQVIILTGHRSPSKMYSIGET